MQISFTEKKNVRKSFGKLKESLSIPNLIEVQKNSYDELTFFDTNAGDLTKGFDRVFKSIFPIEDLNDKATLEYMCREDMLNAFGTVSNDGKRNIFKPNL